MPVAKHKIINPFPVGIISAKLNKVFFLAVKSKIAIKGFKLALVAKPIGCSNSNTWMHKRKQPLEKAVSVNRKDKLKFGLTGT